MSIIYLDTSALIKRYIQEQGSDELAEWISSATFVGTSTITYAEMSAALAKIERMQWVSAEEASVAWGNFLEDYPFLVNIEVTQTLVVLAGDLAMEHGLRGYDAVHLAAALIWQEKMGEAVQIATFDKQLWEAAKKVGLSYLPEDLENFNSM